jgi:energy-coupling factor transporter ATP-binding protein EcfA2
MSKSTIDEMRICPYTGLRSFTEEESLYFKGRDLQVDQITALLEQNKFLMVTGASGEGKSSLIYAGLIPNARAGFFKAKYSNWVIADFRPERNPVTNMAKALAEQFDSNPATVETELRRGYSSLVDLYTNSPFYIDEENSPADLSDTDLKNRKRKAANLLIIVDQFEEFFTNPENFFNETLSKDSQIVVNLILETARIAIRKNLPVYVVCTMRSDYIGQCSAFRGLPEYIGFSQFFVPRLKRKDLKQVIEEPALLSGIRISQRLIERLVFDIAEGVDQLPILQHALSRIWMVADQGAEELDLIHYAMVGGMPADELPDEDMPGFRNWFKKLPEQQQGFYKNTGLAKIIEIHANQLYENAWEYYNGLHKDNPITQQDAKRIIAISFSCLTKIDNSRAVRNRMSLEEITGIINNPRLSSEVIGEVLNIFREPGNSFIRPFITDDPETKILTPFTVLDITHESLIRNWNKLNQWANKEFEFYSTFLDFQKQLDRWKLSGKSRGYLLPVGPLSYFENWYANCKPNTGWIMRYADSREDLAMAKIQAEEKLSDIREFLKRSARKEMVTRTFMKYGPQRIAAVAAIAIMLVLSGFYWYNADQKKNGRVVEKVKSQSKALIESEEVDLPTKAIYLLLQERHDSGTLLPYLGSLERKNRVKLANEVYTQILSSDKTHESLLKGSLVQIISHDLSEQDSSLLPELKLAQINRFLILLALDQYYLPDQKKQDLLSEMADRDYEQVMRFYGNKKMYRPAVPPELNMAVQMWLTLGKTSSVKIGDMLQLISPVAAKDSQNAFNTYYAKGSFEADGRMPLDFNGGYHTLASLYAAAGDMEHVFWCFQKILDNNEHDYFELPRILNNHLNILEYLYQYDHRDQVPAYLHWLVTKTVDNPPQTILRNAIIRSGYISHMYDINIITGYYRSTRGYLFPNLCFCPRPVFDAMEDDYEKVIHEMKEPSAMNFALALNNKRKAMFYSKYWFDRNMPADTSRLNNWLDQAMLLTSKLSSDSLEGTESSTLVYNGDGVRTSNVKRKHLLMYPDYRDGWFSWSYHTDYYFKYLMNKDLLKSVFKTGEDLQQLHFWVAKAYEWKTEMAPETYSKPYPLPDITLLKILSFVDQHPEGKSFDRNLLYLILANHSFERSDTASGLKYFHQLDLQRIRASSDRYEYLEKIFFLNMMNKLCMQLDAVGRSGDAVQLAGKFTEDEFKALCFQQMAEKAYSRDNDPVTFVYLDSVYSISRKIDFSNLPPDLDCRFGQIRVLSQIGSEALNSNADELLRDIPQEEKFYGILERIAGIAGEGNYYRALTSIPKTLTESQDLICRSIILREDSRAKEKGSGNTDWKAFDQYLDWKTDFINFIPN